MMWKWVYPATAPKTVSAEPPICEVYALDGGRASADSAKASGSWEDLADFGRSAWELARSGTGITVCGVRGFSDVPIAHCPRDYLGISQCPRGTGKSGTAFHWSGTTSNVPKGETPPCLCVHVRPQEENKWTKGRQPTC